MLKGTDRAKGGQPYQRSTSTKSVPVESTLADLGVELAELGLDKNTSKLAQDGGIDQRNSPSKRGIEAWPRGNTM